jgi:hypothetical protein
MICFQADPGTVLRCGINRRQADRQPLLRQAGAMAPY